MRSSPQHPASILRQTTSNEDINETVIDTSKDDSHFSRLNKEIQEHQNPFEPIKAQATYILNIKERFGLSQEAVDHIKFN